MHRTGTLLIGAATFAVGATGAALADSDPGRCGRNYGRSAIRRPAGSGGGSRQGDRETRFGGRQAEQIHEPPPEQLGPTVQVGDEDQGCGGPVRRAEGDLGAERRDQQRERSAAGRPGGTRARRRRARCGDLAALVKNQA
jgi:hypothetical protein